VNVFEGEMSWKRRLAIVLAFLWLAVVLVMGTSAPDGFALFVVLGLLPVATLWGSSFGRAAASHFRGYVNSYVGRLAVSL
jgi:hypothetical protein